MPRIAHLALLIVGCCFCLPSAPATAAGKKKSAEKSDAAAAMVEKVLRSEVAGPVDRRGQLAETLKQQPDSPAARWQAGYVRDGRSWRSFDDPPHGAAQTELLEQYRLRRSEATEDFQAHLALADWCQKHGFPDREWAHL